MSMTLESHKRLEHAPRPESPWPPHVAQSLKRFDLWAENSHEVVAELTLDGRLAYISPSVKIVLGYDPDEVLGLEVLSQVHREDLAQVQAHVNEPLGWVTCRVRHKDASWRWMEASGRKFLDPDGAQRLWVMARDITGWKLAEDDRQQLAAKLQHAQAFETLGMLASGIAHDFNNILTAIIINTEMARLQTDRQPKLRPHLDQVLTASQLAKNLAQQILDFGRQQPQERQPIKLHEVVGEMMKLIRSTLPATIEIRTDVRDSSSLVLADPTQIHQVLMNLCTNAVQAIHPRHGRIEVRLDSFLADRLYTRAEPKLQPGGYVRLTVADTGSGMDAKTLRRIFEPFFTTKGSSGGSGLGMAVVQRIIKDHHGAVHVSSQPGEGTVFELFFPRHEASTTEPARIF